MMQYHPLPRKSILYLLILFGIIPAIMIGCSTFSKKPVIDPSNDLLPANPVKCKTNAVPDAEDILPPEESEIDYLPAAPMEEEMEEDTENIAPDEKIPNKNIQEKLDEALDFLQASQDFWQQGELDNALHALDQAYALITEVGPYDVPKLNQQKDDLRFMIAKRILEIYASRHATVKGNHNAIPIVINEHVQKEIDYFTKGKGRDFFISSYKRSGRYRNYILKALTKAGIPPELSWLPLIESGFKVRALSSARALGLWQFIPSTGYKFGLKRNLYIDERLDPYKSTQAAIEYLKELHEIFGDWQTVLAAYNCGEGRVLSIIRNQNVNYLDDFWDLYQRLPSETARYVPKFMAAIYILNHLDKYGMGDLKPDPPVKFDTLNISKQAYLKDIAKAIHLPEKKLTDINPELRYKLLPPEDYELKVPLDQKGLLLACLDKIPEYTPSRPGVVYHRVRPGETLSTIACRYGTTINQIARYNNIYRKNYIVSGKILKIPQSSSLSGDEENAPVISYTVRQGDSLWILAKRYDTTTKKIEELNNLKTVNLYIGQKLSIPAGPGHSRTPAVYSVRQGDTPSAIAKRYNISIDQLLQINNLTLNSTIYPGQELRLQ